MYRKGLTRARIAALCGAVPQTVSRHINVQRSRFPEMEIEHLANRPDEKPAPARPAWRENIDALAKHVNTHARFPTTSDPDPANQRLAHWLSLQMRAVHAGRLSEDRRALLSVLPGWSANQRSEEAAARWKARLSEVKTFSEGAGRWPRFRNSGGEAERVLGVWLHAQRQKASQGHLAAVERQQLDASSPGWNTWGRTDECLVGTQAEPSAEHRPHPSHAKQQLLSS